MARLVRLAVGLTLVLTLGIVRRATAADPAAPGVPGSPTTTPPPGEANPPPAPGDAATGPASTPIPSAPAPSTTAPPPPIGGASPSIGGVPMVDASLQSSKAVRYGAGARFRVTSVPRFMLNIFTDQNVPLTSYAFGVEFFRRTSSFDLVVGLSYQNLSPADGNWLGKGNPGDTDTDLIQFRSLAMIAFDVAFVLHTDFSEYVGLLYGGGVGIGIITGEMLRTSAGGPPNSQVRANCATAPGDETLCYPVCAGNRCTEAQLAMNAGNGNDDPATPSRFAEKSVPSVVPVVNILTGFYFRVPSLPGLEMRIEGGFFFPYFFAGGGVGYRF